VSLTVGTGPFGEHRAGRFNFRPPDEVVFLDEAPGRIRALLGGEVVVDCLRARLVHRTGKLPVYVFPEEDVRRELLQPSGRHSSDPVLGETAWWALRVGDRVVPDAVWSYETPAEGADFLAGYLGVVWSAVDEWFCEDEQLFGHPRDPYSRIDVVRSTRRVQVAQDGVLLADSRRAKILFETALPPRYYLPWEDVRNELLVPSSKRTRCAYKGSATHWSVRVGDRVVPDLVWSYPEPMHDAEPVRDLLAFYNERVDLDVEGVRQDRPATQWSSDD
jgi:uncharacterized protein (DUF427 family)